MFHDILRAQVLPLRTPEEFFGPQWHLRAFEGEEHRYVTDVHSSTEARKVVFASTAVVDRKLRRLKAFFPRNLAILSSTVPYF